MRIHVVGDGHRLTLAFPNGLLCNRVMASVASGALKKNSGGFYLTTEQICLIFQALRRCKKQYPGLVLVDVRSSNGELVEIKL